MTWSVHEWSRGPYAAGDGTEIPVPGQVEIPPPVPDATTRWTYTSYIGIPWSMWAWSGGGPTAVYPGGGVVAAPDSPLGVIRVFAWWPDAEILHIYRVHGDGTQYLLRDGVQIVSELTRRNYATNPSIEAGNNGYVPGTGAPTLTQVSHGTVTGIPAGDFALQATIAGSGTCQVTIPQNLVVSAGTVCTIAMSLRFTARPTTCSVATAWQDTVGGALSTSTANLSADEINYSVDQFYRQVTTATAPVSAASAASIKIAAGGLPAGASVFIDAVTIEAAATDGSYFDGDTFGALWTGTAELSSSVLAPVIILEDAEAPLDVPVVYMVVSTELTGGSMISVPVILLSNGLSWLSSPDSPGRPRAIQLAEVPVLDHEIEQGIFWPLDGRFPVVVTDALRHAPSGTMDIVYLSYPERDALMEWLATGQPLLLRAPAEYGFGEGMWLSIGTVSDDRGARKGWHDTGLLNAEFQQVDAPEVA